MAIDVVKVLVVVRIQSGCDRSSLFMCIFAKAGDKSCSESMRLDLVLVKVRATKLVVWIVIWHAGIDFRRHFEKFLASTLVFSHPLWFLTRV
jgi:hypothetical protein